MLKTLLSLGVVVCALGTPVAGQDAATVADRLEPRVSYIVQLSEYRLAEPLDASVTATEILERLTGQEEDAAGEPVETIRLTTLSDTECMVQFGRRVSVTTGQATSSRGVTVRNVQAVDVGTIVQLTVYPQGEQVGVELTFDSSRLDGGESDDVPPDVIKTQIQATQLVALGKPCLVGSSTTSSSSLIVMTVTRN